MKKKPRSTVPKTTNQVRIIGGMHKRRLLSFIDADGLRPTPDRMRETLFNWLMGHLSDATVLDVCAGSGVLGAECLSRGAKFATFIEYQTAQAKLLSDNLNTLCLSEQSQVIAGDALTKLPSLTQTYDIVFIDPPYALNLWQKLLNALQDNKLIHQDSLIYLEADKSIETIINLDDYHIIKNTKAGQVYSYLLQIA